MAEPEARRVPGRSSRRPHFLEFKRPPTRTLPNVLPAEVVEALARFDATMQRLRAVSRPEGHAYLDMIGVLPTHRRQGIAATLLEAGHAWAEELRLSVALDTDTDENVAFYERRGYEVMARERLPDSDGDLVAMRRTVGERTRARPVRASRP